MLGYCVSCKKKTNLVSPKKSKSKNKNGTYLFKGFCPYGHKMCTFSKK